MLLTISNPKTAKGEGAGYLTAVLHLAPSNLSGRNVCPYASPGCAAACLNTAGRGGISAGRATFTAPSGAQLPDNQIQHARIRRTLALFDDRAEFVAQLRREIQAHVRRAARHGLRPAVRLNGTSDLRFDRFARAIFESFPDVQFYDYTKDERKALAYAAGQLPTNYHVTFSRSETNDESVARVLEAGGNVAVVFGVRRGQPLPTTYHGRKVVDGDTTDLRFLDPAGVVVGLRSKGRARRDASGFTVNAESATCAA